jgi:hypothetical protein
VEPRLGDDLTNSEDIFIGMAMVNEGYRNIQVPDVSARTVEPEVQRLPKQMYLWSSAFLQSAYYFDALLKSPFKALKRRHRGDKGTRGGFRAKVPVRSVAYAGGGGMAPPAMLSITDLALPSPLKLRAPASSGSGIERRRIVEPYRQPFGQVYTTTLGRPAGWAVMSSAIEKVGFPTVLLAMVLIQNWEGVLITVGAETFLTLTALVIAMKGQRLEYLFKGIAVTPIRYALLAWELVTIARFAADLWLTRNRRWRK